MVDFAELPVTRETRRFSVDKNDNWLTMRFGLLGGRKLIIEAGLDFMRANFVLPVNLIRKYSRSSCGSCCFDSQAPRSVLIYHHEWPSTIENFVTLVQGEDIRIEDRDSIVPVQTTFAQALLLNTMDPLEEPLTALEQLTALANFVDLAMWESTDALEIVCDAVIHILTNKHSVRETLNPHIVDTWYTLAASSPY